MFKSNISFEHIIHQIISDTCQLCNGGCDADAICSHDPTTNAVVCTCKVGYTNVGIGSTVVCKGNTLLMPNKIRTIVFLSLIIYV